MTESVIVRKQTGQFQRSSSGSATPLYDEIPTIMFIQPQDDVRRSTEALEVGYVPTGLYLGVGLYDFPFDSHDQIVWGTHVFDILAPPRREWSYIRNEGSHTELELQEVGMNEAGVDAVAQPEEVGGVGG